MASLLLIFRAFKLKRATKRLLKAKENALRLHRGERPRHPWYEECWEWTLECIKNNFCQTFCPCCVMTKDKNSNKYKDNFLRRPCLDGTFENYAIKSFLGFLFGLILTTALFFFLFNQLNCNPRITAIVCCVLGFILTNGLAFSHQFRCMIFLALPELFSSRGRIVLLAYTYVLVMSGPTKNALRNANILVQSINCGQEIVIKQTKAILKSIFAPLIAIVDVMREILKALKAFARQMKEAFIAIRDLFLEIIEAIKTIFKWLMSIVDVCTSEYGSPHERCLKAFDDAIEDCKIKMGFFQFLCQVVNAVKYVCEIARIVDLLCMIPGAIKIGIIEPLQEHFRTFARYMYYQFYVNVTFVHFYNYSLEQSKSFKEIRGDIGHEIKKRTEWLTSMIDWSDFVMAFALLILLFKAYLYRIRYLTADHFDNVYISFHVRDIDDRRANMGKETILPLTFREKRKYVSTFSIRMAASERKRLMLAGSILLTSGMQMAFYMILDYALYHLLKIIRFYGRIESKGRLPNAIQLHVKGNGVMADMYRQLITQFDPLMSSVPEFDTTECLPEPIPIDLDKYQQIIILYMLCVLLALTESYGLRLRHVICGCYHPERERIRAVWLYNRILRSRGGVKKFLRRQIRRKLYGDETLEDVSFFEYLISKYKLLAVIAGFFGYRRVNCFACNEPGEPDDLKHCSNSGCKGIYCESCFSELSDMCTVCMKPIDYGDLSDISEERDSSDEEQIMAGFSETPPSSEDDDYEYQKQDRSESIIEENQSFVDIEVGSRRRELASIEDLESFEEE